MKKLIIWLADNKNTPKILIIIISFSILIRIGSAILLGNQISDLPGVSDQISYHNLGIRIANGYGFTFDRPWWPATPAGEPTAHWSYFYSIFVAAIYWVFGPQPLMVRLIQVLIVGFLHPVLVYQIGKHAFSEKIGLLAAAISSLYIYFIYYSATLMTEPFYITSILLILLLAILLVKNFDQISNDRKSFLLFIFLISITSFITILLRQVFLLFLPFLYFWIILSLGKKNFGKSIKFAALSLTITFLLIFPITILNYLRFNQFVLLNTNAGFAFYWANHPIYGTHFEGILTKSTYLDLLPKELYGLNEAALDRELLKRGLEFVIQDPVRYLFLSLSRIPIYFMFWPSPSSSILSNLSRLASFGILLPFMICGTVSTLLGFKDNFSISSPKILLLVFVVIYSLIHIFTWTLIRYRLPVDAVLILFAAIGIQNILNFVKKRANPTNI